MDFNIIIIILKTDNGCSARWTRAVNQVEHHMVSGLRVVSSAAAQNPNRTVVGILLFSVALCVLGLFTNFSVDIDSDTLWVPAGSKPVQHLAWINDNIPKEARSFLLFVHDDNNNVITQEGVRRSFAALEELRQTEGYNETCTNNQNDYVDPYTNQQTCKIQGVTEFWNHSAAIFEAQVSSDADVLTALAADLYPSGASVDLEALVGFVELDQDGQVLSGQSLLVIVEFPEDDDAQSEGFETDAIDSITALSDQWKAEPDIAYQLEVLAERSFDDEFARAIANDIPLMAIVFVVMSIFTCLVFAQCNWIQSQSLLGFGAVVTILLAIMTGYGFMFLIGVPFTSMTQILPFIMFGIGLDDAFIITGEYARTDRSKDPVERMDDTIKNVGLSVSLTTITSILAFGLGAISTIPAVYNLCYYAFPTVAINFLYQGTSSAFLAPRLTRK